MYLQVGKMSISFGNVHFHPGLKALTKLQSKVFAKIHYFKKDENRKFNCMLQIIVGIISGIREWQMLLKTPIIANTVLIWLIPLNNWWVYHKWEIWRSQT